MPNAKLSNGKFFVILSRSIIDIVCTMPRGILAGSLGQGVVPYVDN